MLDVYKVKRKIRHRVLYKDKLPDCDVPGTVEDLTRAIAEDKSEAKECIIIITA